MEYRKIDTDGIMEVEGIPLHPECNEFYDEGSGECNITFEKCDCKPALINAGCGKCDRAVSRYIKSLIAANIVMPSERVVIDNNRSGESFTFWRNKGNTVFMHTDENMDEIRDNWWFKYLKSIPASIWNLTVESYEYPYAFALSEKLNHKKPIEVYVSEELPIVLRYPNRYYVIAPCEWRDIEDIKKEYMEAESAKQRLLVELQKQQDETNRKVEERKNGTANTRPIVPTKDKREQYGKASTPRKERKYFTQRPSEKVQLETTRHAPGKEYHTTRGVRIRG